MNKLTIEVAYALADKQVILTQDINEGTTARNALKQSDILQHFADLDLESVDIGVFGKAVKDDYEMQQGDRIEIYRPLIADPKEVRKRRAKEGLVTKKGGGSAT